MAIPPTDVRGRGASYICTIANVLGKNLQGDGLGVVPLLSLDYSTARLKNGGEGQESVAVEIRTGSVYGGPTDIRGPRTLKLNRIISDLPKRTRQ